MIFSSLNLCNYSIFPLHFLSSSFNEMKNQNSTNNISSDIKTLISVANTRRTKLFTYTFIFAFVVCTSFLAFSPSICTSSPWFNNLFSSSSISFNSSILSKFFPNSTSSNISAENPDSFRGDGSLKNPVLRNGSLPNEQISRNLNQTENMSKENEVNFDENTVKRATNSDKIGNLYSSSQSSPHSFENSIKNQTANAESESKPMNATQIKQNGTKAVKLPSSSKWIEDMIGCDLFDGHWVKDDSYPLYPEGSCPHIDESFNCFLNGRPDQSYQKLRWQPSGCNIPRLNGTDMLERIRGKRLVFVGDSLNRNMWESLVCVLKSSVRDKSKVFEVSGSHNFRTAGSYSFLFKDYNATVELFWSPFLVQEWEMHNGNGTKETLRLDIIEKASPQYKDAHVIVFNTGHWWTHEKTSKGRDYYQEGNKVYDELNVVVAFHKALNTWAKWVDANVDPTKSLVFFRGYSASHFSGGQWNSGGACDKETEPIENERFLSTYPSKMSVLEKVLKQMKTSVAYLNITRMTDYRKDGHPSVYRKQKLNEEERKDPIKFQDCSHWCLPGVPDSWNELLYAELIIKQYQMAH